MRQLTIPILALIIVCVSLLTLYSAVSLKEDSLYGSIFMRQLLWVGLGWVCFFIFAKVHYRGLLSFIYPFYAVVIITLLVVLAAGAVRLGAQRWIKIWWFNFQPSEFAKIALILVLSHYFSRKKLEDITLDTRRMSFYKGLIIPFMLIAVPFALIFKQPDLGTALIILFIFFGMAYFSGVRVVYIISVIAGGVFMLPLFWHFLRDYQRDRLLVFLDPNFDPLGAGYTIIQSKIAIGSGRFFGKGWLSGTQGQLNFLPESHTDFVFGIYSEETGFLGCMILILLYYLIIRKAFEISNRCGDNFGKLLSAGIGLMLGIQVYINISMTLGISPVVGVPLPLMSYGGSSVLLSFISLGILWNIDKNAGAFS